MIAGTWGNNQYIARQPVVHRDVFMTTCYAIPGYYLMLEGSATSASNLEWFVSEFFPAEREELVKLRRQVRQLQTERDILAKATAWFAAKGEKTSGGSTNS